MDNKQQPPKLDIASKDVLGENLEKLKALFPSAVKEGKVDIEALRNLIGDINEPHQEYYNFTWAGKSEAFKIIKERSNATLKPCKDNNESVDFDNTQNIFIEGDNLEVLKILQKTYHNAIKMIYIDPPYNKDKDFIYPDKWSEGLNSYLEYTKLLDEDGNITSSIAAEESVKQGRKHSRWLTMMYPRLFLARNLLRDDGVIFISIDDDEVKNLKMICDEIFGEENFIANFVWESRTSISNDQPVSLNHNHNLLYAKNIEDLKFGGESLDENEYENPDNDPRGSWKMVPLDANKSGGDTVYKITNPNTGQDYLPPNGRVWSINSKEYQRLYEDNRIVFGKAGDSSPKRKLFLKERMAKGDMKTPSSLLIKDVGTTKHGTSETMELFEGKKIFSYPKPVNLIEKFLNYSDVEDYDTILDFFAGSSTTAHAVMHRNSQININSKYIMVQLPEKIKGNTEIGKNCLAQGYKTIAEISKERIRRAAKQIKDENPDYDGDLGFKVFKLDQSNFKQWDENIATTEQFELALESYEDKIRDEAKPLDMIYEVILAKGLSLNSKIDEIKIGSQIMYQVHSDDVGLLACFAKSITQQDIEEVVKIKPDYFICSDSSFENNVALKTNAALALKEANIIFETL